ncbi:MAG: hypothetical protein A2Z14_02050 [Chloroflexi bacterium RBG_16_48_8]|nr:MAG: hypothetical protein A2Z14_02050 [Chloroflexi bacterium RBG_16_48_8]
MLEFYLLSLLSMLLTEYGFKTRKRAMACLRAAWRPRQTLVRILFWLIALAWCFVQTTQKWPVLILFTIAVLVGETAIIFVRRRTHQDLSRNYPLGRPLTHLLPFFFALIPALLGGLFAQRFFPDSFSVLQSYPILALKVMTSFTAMFCWSTMFTVSIVALVRSSKFSDEIEPHLGAGEVIGILERIFTVVLVLAGGLSAVGFAVAAKAAARYPQFKNPAFAEYFLIGTLCSIGLSLLAGLALSLS